MAPSRKKLVLKMFLGVVLGLTTLIILSLLTDEFIASLNKNEVKIDMSWLIIFFFYRFVYTAIGGFVAVKVAKEKPFITAEILGGIIAITYLYGLYTFWNQGVNTDFIILAISGFIAPYVGAYISTTDKKIFLGKSFLKREKSLKKEVPIKEEETNNISKETEEKENTKEVKSAPKKSEKEENLPLSKGNIGKAEGVKKTSKKEEAKTPKTPTKTKKETTKKSTPKKAETKKPIAKKAKA